MSHDREHIILDTHAWLWLMEGDTRIGPAATGRVEEASAYGGVHISILSVWEVAMMQSAARVVFSVPLVTWLEEALATPGLSVFEIDPQVAAESVRLPGEFKGDPVDRLIAATARVRDATLLTADPLLITYGETGHLKVLVAG